MSVPRARLRVGLVGYGFMGRAHSNAFRRVGDFFELDRDVERVASCGRDAAKARAHAATWGFALAETDWRALVARDDIDLV
ncbi:MAG: Gfo/Idh/MocA family oxidoreductase, partial [Rhodobacteraceae bacterium]|nr:Gfo/Idh/MocA family oxidoreductase [Paracoccaceae bacterium]